MRVVLLIIGLLTVSCTVQQCGVLHPCETEDEKHGFIYANGWIGDGRLTHCIPCLKAESDEERQVCRGYTEED